MKKFIVLLLAVSFQCFALIQFTNLTPNVSIYSEYYPNNTSKFKGTLIFENGSGTTLEEWKDPRFFKCVKQIGSVFMYNRSGLGASTPDLHLSTTNPLTAKLVSERLSKLLKKLNLKPPYVIVAHSYGAMYAGYFVLRNQKQVKGIILVDPVPRDFHFSHKLLQKHKDSFEAAKRKQASYIYKHYKGPEAEVAYQLLGFSQTKRSIKKLGPIKDTIPVVIISSTQMEKEHPLREDWFESQKQWLNKNKLSQIYSVQSSHFIEIDQPELVCDNIKRIVNLDFSQ